MDINIIRARRNVQKKEQQRYVVPKEHRINGSGGNFGGPDERN